MVTFLKIFCSGRSDGLIVIHAKIFVGRIGGFQLFLIRVILIAVFNLCGGSTAGHVGAAAFRTDCGVDGNIAGDNLAVILCRFLISIAHMLLLVASDSCRRGFRINVCGSFEGYIPFVGAVLIFAVFAGLAFCGRRFPSCLFFGRLAGVSDDLMSFLRFFRTTGHSLCGSLRSILFPVEESVPADCPRFEDAADPAGLE